MAEEQMRAEFEAWARRDLRLSNTDLVRASNGPYLFDFVGEHWRTWQACWGKTNLPVPAALAPTGAVQAGAVAVAGQGETIYPAGWGEVVNLARNVFEDGLSTTLRGAWLLARGVLDADAHMRSATPAPHAPHEGAKPVATETEHFSYRTTGATGPRIVNKTTGRWYSVEMVREMASMLAAPQEHEARDAARPTWIDPHNRVPAADQTVLVYSQQPWEKAPSIKLDTWAEQHEAPLAWSSATIPTGLGWDEHDDFELVIGWLPLPSAPDAARAVKGDRT